MVGIAQLVSAPDCGSGGPGFESLYPPSYVGRQKGLWSLVPFIMGYRQAVRHSTLTAVFAGSNPVSPVRVRWCFFNLIWDISSGGRALDF